MAAYEQTLLALSGIFVNSLHTSVGTGKTSKSERRNIVKNSVDLFIKKAIDSGILEEDNRFERCWRFTELDNYKVAILMAELFRRLLSLDRSCLDAECYSLASASEYAGSGSTSEYADSGSVSEQSKVKILKVKNVPSLAVRNLPFPL